MSLSEIIFATVASLPESKQQEVLDFAEYLKSKIEKKQKMEQFFCRLSNEGYER